MFGQGTTGQSGFKGFGITATTATTSSTSTPGFSFGVKPAQAAQQQTPASTATFQFAGFGVTTTKNDAKQASDGLKFGLTQSTSTSQPSSISFGGFKTTATSVQPQSTTATTNLSFGGQSLLASAGKQTCTIDDQKNKSTGGFTFGQATFAQSNAQATTTTTAIGSQLASTSAVSLTPKTTASLTIGAQTVISSKSDGIKLPSASTSAFSTTEKSLTYKELEDIINKWVHELDEQEKVFLNQAKQVNTWDRLLIENGEKITLLNSEMERLKTEQSSLNRELDFILSKQQELEETLIPLEDKMKEQQTVPYLQHADIEREKTYQMAEIIDSQLKRMTQDLKDIINHINTSNASLKESDDPMVQVAKILNSHMDSLQWIDQSSMLLQKRVDDVSKYVESQRREHERSLRLTFD